jgi:hypothetical protein
LVANVIMKRNIYLIAIVVLTATFGVTAQTIITCTGEACQKPVYAPNPPGQSDFDFTYWDWTNQDYCNWITYVNGQPQCVNPPFRAGAPRWGSIVDVYDNQDYQNSNSSHVLQQDQGWELTNADFSTSHPYFILYNKYRSVIRCFFYIPDPTTAYSHMAATCKYTGSLSPLGVLGLTNSPVKAPDEYPNANNDLLVSVAQNAGAGSWMSADFPMLFDPNITASGNALAQMDISLWGINDFQLELSGTSTPAGADGQFMIGTSSSNFQQGSFSGVNAKLKEIFEDGKTIGDGVKAYGNLLPSDGPAFLTKHKSEITGFGEDMAKVFENASAITQGISAVIGIFELLSGDAPKTDASASLATSYEISLKGNMTISMGPLNGNGSIKIPGTLGNGTSVVGKYFNCPVGIMTLKNKPHVSRTNAYSRWPEGNGYCQTFAGFSSTFGYGGNYIKYKFDEDLDISLNTIPGLNIVDLKFAFVCKPMRKADMTPKYDILNPVIGSAAYDNCNGYTWFDLSNPVYRDLALGRFIIHKYDGDEIVYGTPYIGKNCFKGITFEVPEDTYISISVMAIYTVGTNSPTRIFKANYDFDQSTIVQTYNVVVGTDDPPIWPYSNYYNFSPYLSLNSGPNASSNTAGTIYLLPGFYSGSGFAAMAGNPYQCNGNTIFETPLAACTSACNFRKGIAFADPRPGQESFVNIFPNPSSGKFRVNLNQEEYKEIHVFNSYGDKVYSSSLNGENPEIELDLSSLPPGVYMVRLSGDTKTELKRIILTK